MDLSPQNKKFLDVLSKVGIDVKDFSDKTFDGLFENVPDGLNCFFDWFIENITSENVLTPFEQAVYHQLESNQMIPNKEEMDCIFASYSPTYEELQSLDANYVKILLPRDLVDLSRNIERLNEISTEIESNYFNIKEKYKNMKEESNILKKQLVTAKQESDDVNILFNNKLEEVKEVLLKEAELKINFDLYTSSLEVENAVFDNIKDLKVFKDDSHESFKIILSEIKEDSACMKTSLVLSQGFLKAKKKEIEVLSRFLQKRSQQESFNETAMHLQLIDPEDLRKVSDDVKILESKLYEKHSEIGQNEIDEILQKYFFEKTGVCESYTDQLIKFKDCMSQQNSLDGALLQILKHTAKDLENESSMRKCIYFKLQEYERNFSNSTSNLEMQNKRFKEVSVLQERHPFLEAVKEITYTEENFGKSEEALNNIMELMSFENGDERFYLQNLRNKLQSAINGFFDLLCGPTSEVLLTPVELSIKFQECVEYEKTLSHSIKQLASAYMEAKDSISKSNRKSLLLWIKFLTRSPLPIKPNKYLEE